MTWYVHRISDLDKQSRMNSSGRSGTGAMAKSDYRSIRSIAAKLGYAHMRPDMQAVLPLPTEVVQAVAVPDWPSRIGPDWPSHASPRLRRNPLGGFADHFDVAYHGVLHFIRPEERLSARPGEAGDAVTAFQQW